MLCQEGAINASLAAGRARVVSSQLFGLERFILDRAKLLVIRFCEVNEYGNPVTIILILCFHFSTTVFAFVFTTGSIALIMPTFGLAFRSSAQIAKLIEYTRTAEASVRDLPREIGRM